MKGKYYTMKDVQKMIVIQSVIDRKRTGKEAGRSRPAGKCFSKCTCCPMLQICT